MRIHQFMVGTMGVCCYIASCEKTKKAAVVDPGADEQRIIEEIAKEDVSLEYIIATHGHPDHVGAMKKLQDATGAKVVMHKEDVSFFGKPEVDQYFSMFGFDAAPPADIEVTDGDEITLGEEKFEVIHTPGHTPGGICLYCAPNVITGDSLFVGGIGRTDFPGGDHQLLLDSIRNRLLSLPAETIVWPGHGYGGLKSTIGNEKVANPFL